jgi:hypothetical protein
MYSGKLTDLMFIGSGLCTAGMPPESNLFDPALLAPAEELAQLWAAADPACTGVIPTSASPADVKGWPADLKLAFVTKLARLAAAKRLHSAATRSIDRLNALGNICEPEVCSTCCRALCSTCNALNLPRSAYTHACTEREGDRQPML